jgi:hypothetical protein
MTTPDTPMVRELADFMLEDLVPGDGIAVLAELDRGVGPELSQGTAAPDRPGHR